jgi:porin
MCSVASTFARATAFWIGILFVRFAAYSQETKPSPTTPKSAVDLGTQEELTGDWGGVRSQWKEKGVELEFKASQFAQGVASGGVDTGAVGNGKFQTEFKFDFGKLAGWNFWSAEVKTETRFGGPLLGGTGTVSPANTTAIIPTAAGTSFTISALNVTKIFPIDLKKGDLFAVSVGRFNLIDVLDEDFFAGFGTERFFNMAQIGPLTVLRQVPLITEMVNFAYVRGGEPIFTFALMDPNDHSLNPGLSDPFADGVTFSPGFTIPTKHFGKTAKHSFGGAITTKKYSPFDAIRQVILPGPPINPIEPKGGSWSVNYVFRQYLVERGPRDGWGLFAQVSFADKTTSPVTTFFDVGLGGNGLIEHRPLDEFGIAYAYTDLSKVLKDNLDLFDPTGLRRLRVEHQVELFYNFHITPWLRLTADLQVLRPSRPIAETAIVPGARLEVIF